MLTIAVSHALLAAGLAAASEPVDIVRDTWGIPHVFAQTDAGAIFGAGYATAEDRLYQMHRTRMAAKGSLAELEGLRTNPETGETTVDQDIYFRKIRFYHSITEIEPTLDAETRQFLRAYADGVNYYIQRHQAEIIANPLFHGQLPRAWTPVDCLAAWDRSASHFDGGIQTNEAETLHKYEAAGSCQAYQCVLYPTHDVMDEAAAVVQQAEVPVTTQMAICAFAQSVGFPCIPPAPCGEACPGGAELLFRKCSHAWAVGGAALEGGSSMVVSMPQAPVFAPGTWHEIHVKGATFDMRGLSFAGSPGFLVGFSRETARAMTGFSIDFSDTFRLKPGQAPDTYEFDGVDYPIQSQNQTVKVRVGPSSFVLVPITVRWAGHIGPIVTDFMLDVHPGEEYAARFVPLDTDQGHTVQAAIAMMRAADADELRASAMGWRFPPAHCVYADGDGEVGYMPLGTIPVRATGGNCLLGRSAQSGAVSSMQWQGYIPFDLKPQVSKPAGGAVFSGNHLIVGSWYPVPLHLGLFNTGDGDRSWRLRERLDTGTHPVFTPQEVADIRFDVVNPALREVIRAGVYLRDNDPPTPPNLSPSAIQNVNELEGWLNAGALSKLDQPKFAGAYWLDTMFRYDENLPWKDLVATWGNRNLPHYLKDLKVRLDRWDATGADPMIGDQEVLYLSNSLGTGFDRASQFYGAPAAWQAGLTAEIGHQNVLYAGSLEGFEPSLNPAYDVDYAGFIAPHGGTIRSQRAAASVIIMNLRQPDASLACTPTGVSENPASVHFDDQADEWIVGNLRAAPLSRSAITDPVTITLQYPPP